jgi:hypothetical protein
VGGGEGLSVRARAQLNRIAGVKFGQAQGGSPFAAAGRMSASSLRFAGGILVEQIPGNYLFDCWHSHVILLCSMKSV